MFSSNDITTGDNKIEWFRSNSNLLRNSCSLVFRINFRSKNHPTYESISLNLYSISSGASLKLNIGFKENSEKEADMLNAQINNIEGYKWKSELVNDGKNVIGRAPISLEIEVLNPYRPEFFLKIYEILNQVCESKLSSQGFEYGIYDIIRNVIPNVNNKNSHIERSMSNGLIKPDNCSHSNVNQY